MSRLETCALRGTLSTMLRVTEIFHSVQGESTQAGRPCVFVRLTGCDLRCVWCDTEYAFEGGAPMSVEEVVSKVASYGCPLVEVTGGEPLLQRDCVPLMQALLARGHEVMLETGGHRSVAEVPTEVRRILDVKCPGSGEAGKNHLENLEQLTPRDEVKFVIADRADYEWAREFVRERRLWERCPVLFSPVRRTLEARSLAEWILEDRLPVRLQMQIHKLLWGEAAGR